MIESKTGDLLAEDADALVNAVNCVGVMGRGIAAQFKRAWPANFKSYAADCERRELEPGRLVVFETGNLIGPRFIVNFPTKRHWRDVSRLADIDAGLAALATEIQARDIHSIALPALGAGLGQLNWHDVRRRIDATLGALVGVRVIVFEPRLAPSATSAGSRDEDRRSCDE
jgi:O-acetyl-ADP-ribose deacetylase (regulator of RNase III)